jgi:hypothetical protein
VAPLDFTLSFTATEWVCYNEEIHLTAPTLEAIDDHLESYLHENLAAGKYEVRMHFDFDRFPRWHRQYMPHYFNRKLIFNIN